MSARSRDKGRRVRILVIGGLAVAVAIAGFFAYRTWWGSSDAPVTYVTEQAAKTTLISSVSGTGNVSAGSTSSVVPTVSGEVTDLSVQVGDTVTTGQVLFVLVNAQLDLDVQTAEANYQQAQQRLNTAELAVLQAEQSLDDLEDQQASQSASLPTSSAVVLASYSPASSNTGVRLASTGWPATTSTTSTSDSTTTTSTTSTTLPPTTLPPTTLPPTTLPPTTGPPVTTPPTTSTPPTSQPGGGRRRDHADDVQDRHRPGHRGGRAEGRERQGRRHNRPEHPRLLGVHFDAGQGERGGAHGGRADRRHRHGCQRERRGRLWQYRHVELRIVRERRGRDFRCGGETRARRPRPAVRQPSSSPT